MSYSNATSRLHQPLPYGVRAASARPTHVCVNRGSGWGWGWRVSTAPCGESLSTWAFICPRPSLAPGVDSQVVASRSLRSILPVARLGDCALSQLNHQLNRDVIVSLGVFEHSHIVFCKRCALCRSFLVCLGWGNAHPRRPSSQPIPEPSLKNTRAAPGREEAEVAGCAQLEVASTPAPPLHLLRPRV